VTDQLPDPASADRAAESAFPADPPAAPQAAPPRPSRLRRAWAWVRQRETLLWWLHSAWALAFGVGVMWLGSRNFAWLRVTYAYIAFIWLTSLLVPRLLVSRRLPVGWRKPVHLGVNYFNKNFYQQLLFFVLPVYWASVTPWSLNMWFVGIVAVSAVLSTFDVVYDRHLSVKRGLTALFFAFNLFACLNVALPVLWSVSNATAMRGSALLALLGFATLRFSVKQLLVRPRVQLAVALGGVLLGLLVEFGRPLIPPAPLALVDPVFATAVQRTPLRVTAPVAELPAGFSGRLHVVTPISAPLGLKDRVRHRWSVNDVPIGTTASYEVTGGRAQGYRLWTAVPLTGVPTGATVRVDVETEAGQLIGRAQLPVR
jgi:hypothetical protein